MKESYIKTYGKDKIQLAEYLCNQNGGHLNYSDTDMVLYWVRQAEVFNHNGITKGESKLGSKILIAVSGGVIQSVMADSPFISVEILDYDNLKQEGKSSVEIDTVISPGVTKNYPYSVY